MSALFSAPGTARPAPLTATFAAPGGTVTRGGPPPTGEQDAIVDAYLTGQHLVVEAGAGTGKTSTLRMLAESRPRRRGVYVAYNKAIADEASRRFPGMVECRTAHSFAYRAIGQRYANRLAGGYTRNGGGSARLPSSEVARILGLRGERLGVGEHERFVSGSALARIAGETVDTFCRSADAQIAARHVPVRAGLEHAAADLVEVVLPAAVQIWEDLINPHGRLYFTHDHYLKIWQLLGPTLPCEYVMLDEAQDANPVIDAIVAAQEQAQLVYVGDRAQAIYGWRGAVDAMASFDGLRLQLTRSFRFGQAVADEANDWLERLDADLRLTGHEPVTSTVGWVETPRAILCRTNGGAFGSVMDALEAGRKVALVGDGKEIQRFAWAAKSLMDGRGCDLPELAAFKTWRELQQYVDEEPSARDLQSMVKMVNRYGPSTIIDTTRRLTPERRADLTVSTAHKAKGLEWPSVRIGGDFTPPLEGDKVNRAELMLAYVSVTRAQQQLDPGSLTWPADGRFDDEQRWWPHECPDRNDVED